LFKRASRKRLVKVACPLSFKIQVNLGLNWMAYPSYFEQIFLCHKKEGLLEEGIKIKTLEA
jgi:hypothetical protein